jgi:hypothetical protein
VFFKTGIENSSSRIIEDHLPLPNPKTGANRIEAAGRTIQQLTNQPIQRMNMNRANTHLSPSPTKRRGIPAAFGIEVTRF